jgi:hypothetical protein
MFLYVGCSYERYRLTGRIAGSVAVSFACPAVGIFPLSRPGPVHKHLTGWDAPVEA